MTTHIALLRAVNVGGRKVTMAELRETVSAMKGLGEVRTLLHTGNLVLTAEAGGADLEQRLEAAIAERFGIEVPVMARTAGQWRALVEANPFPREAADTPGYLVLLALKGEPVAGGAEALDAAIPGREYARVLGDNAYLVYPDGQGQSRLTPVLIERKLGVKGTARNWNTVLKLKAMAGGD
jgi:uncharacterized protein (DUF1697 family)